MFRSLLACFISSSRVGDFGRMGPGFGQRQILLSICLLLSEDELDACARHLIRLSAASSYSGVAEKTVKGLERMIRLGTCMHIICTAVLEMVMICHRDLSKANHTHGASHCEHAKLGYINIGSTVPRPGTEVFDARSVHCETSRST